MPDLRLARVASVQVSTERARWEQQRYREQGKRSPRRPASAWARLLAAVLPGRDPDTCEVALDCSPDGAPRGVVIRDAASGAVLLRLGLDQVMRISGDGTQRGLLFERRG